MLVWLFSVSFGPMAVWMAWESGLLDCAGVRDVTSPRTRVLLETTTITWRMTSWGRSPLLRLDLGALLLGVVGGHVVGGWDDLVGGSSWCSCCVVGDGFSSQKLGTTVSRAAHVQENIEKN